MVAGKKCIVGLLSLTSHFRATIAQSSSASFSFPETPIGTIQILTVNVVDTVVVQWTSNFKDSWLWLWCGAPEDKTLSRWFTQSVMPIGSLAYSPSTNGTVGNNWKEPYKCHWDLMYENAISKAVNGATMLITSVTSREPSTYALQRTPTGLSSGTNTISPTSSTPTSASNTYTPSASVGASSDKSGLSTGATAGIAVGVIGGAIVILALGIMLWRTKRKVDTMHSRIPAHHDDSYIKPQGVAVASSYKDQASPPYEMHTSGPMELEPYQAPQELPGSISRPVKP